MNVPRQRLRALVSYVAVRFGTWITDRGYGLLHQQHPARSAYKARSAPIRNVVRWGIVPAAVLAGGLAVAVALANPLDAFHNPVHAYAPHKVGRYVIGRGRTDLTNSSRPLDVRLRAEKDNDVVSLGGSLSSGQGASVESTRCPGSGTWRVFTSASQGLKSDTSRTTKIHFRC